LLAVVTVALAVGAAPAAGAASPTIVVTPNRRLVNGQTVQVAGAGFGAREPVAGLECVTGATDPSECDFNAFTEVITNRNGAFDTTFVLHRTIVTNTGFVDCAPSACELLFASEFDFGSQAMAALKFDRRVPLPPTSVAVSPAKDLADRQTVKVTGAGFTRAPFVEMTECVVAAFSCRASSETVTRSDGTFSAKVSLDRLLTDQSGNLVDCAAAPGTCEVLAYDPTDLDYHAVTPLAFDASLPPPPPPTLTVRPHHNLPFYARVSVTATHWSPGDIVLIAECDSRNTFACDFLTIVQPDANGTIQITPMVHRKLLDFLGGHEVDCAKARGRCVLIAQSGFSTTTLTVPLDFDAAAPIPPAAKVTITPGGPYGNRQVVQIHGHHFAPYAAFSVSECATSSNAGVCLFTLGPAQFTDAHGDFTTSFELERRLLFLNCTDPSVACVLEASSEGGVVVDQPIEFQATASIPSSPHAANSSSTLIARTWVARARAGCLPARSPLRRALTSAEDAQRCGVRGSDLAD
jgi:hypothetical protein